jgi:hypothetical protein
LVCVGNTVESYVSTINAKDYTTLLMFCVRVVLIGLVWVWLKDSPHYHIDGEAVVAVAKLEVMKRL